jgi:formylmethanofuran dehydrogenase subunit B
MAAGWLKQASQPLIVLSSDVDLDAARIAIRLAKKVDAVLALDDQNYGSSLTLAMKSYGLLMGTLGELRNSASQIVLLGVDPAREMPRFWSFLSLEQKEKAINIEINNPLEAVRHLRMALRSGEQTQDQKWTTVAKKVVSAQTGAVVFGMNWLQDGFPLISELLLWLKELNQVGRWYGLPAISEPNQIGLVEMLLSETGCSSSVRFMLNQVEEVPNEIKVEGLFAERRYDVIVLIESSDQIHQYSLDDNRQSKGRIIHIGPVKLDGFPDIWLPSKQPGVNAYGEMLRLDCVPIHLHPVIESIRPSTLEILSRIIDGVDL